jgi:hypothetical protein
VGEGGGVKGKTTAGPSTPLRSTQDANFWVDGVGPATWRETAAVAMAALLAGVGALAVCYQKGYLLLFWDAASHMGIARSVYDSQYPGLSQLVGTWLPLSHLLMLPFVWKMEWWQNGLAGAWPSLGCYVAGVVGFFRLCRKMVVPRWAWVATAFYGLNPNLLYLSTTAMTEPLFLALLLWITLATLECMEAIRGAEERVTARRLVVLGALIFLGVMARYDGWALGAVAWCAVAWELWWAGGLRGRVWAGLGVLTALTVAGPALWLWLNWHFTGDPLWFARGPFSSALVAKKAGWPRVNPGWALLIYMRTAQLDAAAWETGFTVMAAALAGLWIALRRRMGAAALLWLPLPFYTYMSGYGATPVFIPEMWPHWPLDTRYAMELLPALALFACVALATLEARVARKGLMYGAVLGLVGMNAWGMVYGPALVRRCASVMLRRPVSPLALQEYSPPLVLRDAELGTPGRVAFERRVGRVLEAFPKGSTVLMVLADHFGEMQDAGVPLHQMVNENDREWHGALEAPARSAQYVVAFDGDAASEAVAAHPEGLVELTTVCGDWMRCARVYRSTEFAGR